ncbi:hypothetical protein HHK36_001504 [Tetracentron sinense]|uniref:Nuclear transcription factor Y subunit n=1 Tax=Tetracentron sinense TaxID=13715 RepID=A0A834ZTR4_TETSI|nr:hypothetical protein HHK36_001504 [Tetracentron sinense]
MTSSVHDLSSHSDNDGAHQQPKKSEPQIQYQSPATGIFHPGMAPPSAEYMMPPHHEVGHAVAQAAYPYPDPYYRSIFAPYSAQPLSQIHPPLMGIQVQQAGVPLPSDAVEEPVYVNAKQYRGILRRRQSRAKAESEKKLIKPRKPYLHESRHLHAVRRARGCGGRFTKMDENQQNEVASDEKSQPKNHLNSNNNQHASESTS